MGDKYMIANTLCQCTKCRNILFVVADVRRHFAEELRKRYRIFRELHALVVVRPNTDAPYIEPKHLVGHGLYRSRCGRASGASSASTRQPPP